MGGLNANNSFPALDSRLQCNDVCSCAIEDGEADGIFPKEFFDDLLESCGLGVITIGNLVTSKPVPSGNS